MSGPAELGRPRQPALTMPAAAAPGARVAGRWGLAATAVSVVLTFVVAVAGPSLMEPALPGGPGQPPWAFTLQLSPYLAVALTAAAVAAGTTGLGLSLRAARRGWTVPPAVLVLAGLAAVAALALVPPFGSSDHLSYAAYGRMAVMSHNPYTTTPAALARTGDPVARAVQDWKDQSSVYGSLATGVQALASVAGGASARLTVFVLSLVNAVAFAVTGLVLHRLTRGDRARQVRAALLWTANPLLLQVLVAGEHIDSQALVFAVTAIALFALSLPNEARALGPLPRSLAAAGAGVAVGLAVAVKVSMVLVAVGLAAAALAVWWRGHATPAERPSRRAHAALPGAGLVVGLAATVVAALVPWGLRTLRPALRAGSFVSVGSPWRVARLIHFAVGERAADDLVRAGAVVLAVLLVVLFAQPLLSLASRGGLASRAGLTERARTPAGAGPAEGAPPAEAAGLAEGVREGPAVVCAAGVAAVALAWLFAWPYVLPWYDALGWAPLALLPWLPRPWSALDGLLLTRTAALAFGYLPARGIRLPAGLGWLESVVRTAVTPAALFAATIALVVVLWPWRPWHAWHVRSGTATPGWLAR